MISILKFKNADRGTQLAEIEYTAKVLECTYRAYEEVPLQSFRGQIWKLEKLLTVFHYLQK
jgi:hypothetical protein